MNTNNNTNIEIEYKTLLSQTIYEDILQKYFKDCEPFSQTNEYFCDVNDYLSNHRYSLRVRHVHDILEFTLKKPDGFAKIEMNEYLTKEQYDKLIHHTAIESEILKELEKINVTVEDLYIFTSLTTKRYEIDYQGGHLCLDYNQYNGNEDYEMEYEAVSEQQGLEVFQTILFPYKILYKMNCLGKMTRAINTANKH